MFFFLIFNNLYYKSLNAHKSGLSNAQLGCNSYTARACKDLTLCSISSLCSLRAGYCTIITHLVILYYINTVHSSLLLRSRGEDVTQSQ